MTTLGVWKILVCIGDLRVNVTFRAVDGLDTGIPLGFSFLNNIVTWIYPTTKRLEPVNLLRFSFFQETNFDTDA